MVVYLFFAVAFGFRLLDLSVPFDSFQEFFCGLKRPAVGLGKFEFSWHKLTAKCLGE